MTRNVLEWLEKAARLNGDCAAFETPGDGCTWHELRDAARSVGSFIASTVSRQSPVLIIMDKSPECVSVMLGCVYAGCFYTPVDSSMPVSRMKLISGVLRPKLIICDEKYLDTAKEISGGARVYTVPETLEAEDAELLEMRRAAHIDNDLLYVLFTSGSTGVPKGVSITHRSVIDFVDWACEALRLPVGVRFASQAPFYFDNSVLDIYCALRMSGSVYIINRGDFTFPRKLMASLKDSEADTIFWVPSALTALANSGLVTKEALPDIKRVFFCGEVMPCRTLNILKRALPEADFVNMYGPTEITDVCAWYRVDREFDDNDSLPIGFPCANTRIHLIDGEICVTGTCLSPGYYNAPEKTAAAFIQNPLRPQIRETIYRTGDLGELNDRGELMFLGRRDSQIKRSGYRIELGEIETALCSADGVDMGCCWYVPETERIVAVYTGTADEKSVKVALKAAVPRYMLPDKLIRRTEAMPRTGSGKIDRMSLKKEYSDEHSLT